MRRERLTLKKIATELNVSISTVSKALNDSKEISLETRDRIKAFAKLYHYKPNNIALSLKNQQTKTLGVIIPEVVHYFFATVIDGIEQVATEKGYNVMVALSNESRDREVALIEALSNNSIDGFLLSLSKKTLEYDRYQHIEEIIEQGIPVVLFDRVKESLPCDKVIVNDYDGAYQAVKHLIDRGRKRIVLITTPDYVSVGKLRTEGYLSALRQEGIPIENQRIIRVQETSDSQTDLSYLREELQHLITKEAVDAIFAVNEIYAAEAIALLKEMNFHIPKDIAVICFTDGLISKYLSPSLSTVNQHGHEIGRRAAQVLIKRIEGDLGPEDPFQTSVVHCKIIQRASS